MKTIPINIWDDFYEDGYVPDGEIQETYMYVEDTKFTHVQTIRFLTYLKDWIENNIKYLDGVKIFYNFYDSKVKYPNVNEDDYPGFHFSRSEMRFEHLTHKMLDRLVDDLGKANLSIDGLKFNIYSES